MSYLTNLRSDPSRDPSRVAGMIGAARRAVALTGAGISTAAGIPDFRGPRGVYATGKYPAEKVFAIAGFRADPRLFFDFSREFLATTRTITPTFTHRFLAELEAQGKLRAVITQNVDRLHRLAGSRRLLEVHGSYETQHCLQCHREYAYPEFEAKLLAEPIPTCDDCRRGAIKPDIVFFGEAVKHLDAAEQLVRDSDLLLVIGSSLTVQPVAELPALAGGDVVVVNRGAVGLARERMTLHVDEECDDFFRAVRGCLAPPILTFPRGGGRNDPAGRQCRAGVL